MQWRTIGFRGVTSGHTSLLLVASVAAMILVLRGERIMTAVD